MAVNIRRREFLASSALATIALGAGGLAGCATAASSPRSELDQATVAALQRMARLLYPHDAVSDDVYTEVVAGLAAASDAAALGDGVAALDRAGAGPWLARGEAEQIAALQAIEDGAFFAAMRGGVQARLYEHPAVWEAIGYPGPALPLGGYLNRGFDDIDWLPGEDA